MRTLLIDIYDVTAQPITGDSITLEAPATRAAESGAVIRPYSRLVELVDGKATVEVDPGPLDIKFHNNFGRQVVINATVPDGGDPITLRELILMDIGTLDDVPGIRDALDAKADADNAVTLDAFADALADKADLLHGHALDGIIGLQDALDDKAAQGHGHALDDVRGLRDVLDAKLEAADFDDRTNQLIRIATDALVDGATEALDTLKEIAIELAKDDDPVAALVRTVAGKAEKSHTHAIGDVTGLQTALDGKASQATVDTALAGKAEKSHTHRMNDITNLPNLTSVVQPNALILRDSNGSASIADPTGDRHIANKKYVDAQVDGVMRCETIVTASTLGVTAGRLNLNSNTRFIKHSFNSSSQHQYNIPANALTTITSAGTGSVAVAAYRANGSSGRIEFGELTAAGQACTFHTLNTANIYFETTDFSGSLVITVLIPKA
ncbi:hypothetical protein HMPREF3153_09680 [Corynebacterium sp. HMSC06C06]|uniref:Tail fiber protein n=1 Tax=Corynebacterium striatum TaxID=43770 RepID=A0ABX7DDN2_CORST|nr:MULTISPECIES: hypothetical protein [Corynebacterium]OFT50487.1 hypothetical protein HMPREF3153_09680 [Corynebacterium sp. HMSC06C06]QQU76458.1 hypothetical protein I6I72_10130 [Corynebacterium striatum]